MAGDARGPAARRTVYDVADGWHKSGATGKMHDELRRQCRIAAGRKPEPTAAVIDSQSVKAAETVASGSRGYDAGKKVNCRYLEPGFRSWLDLRRCDVDMSLTGRTELPLSTAR